MVATTPQLLKPPVGDVDRVDGKSPKLLEPTIRKRRFIGRRVELVVTNAVLGGDGTVAELTEHQLEFGIVCKAAILLSVWNHWNGFIWGHFTVYTRGCLAFHPI